MAAPVEQWITDVPPITRAWVAASVGASVLVVSHRSSCSSVADGQCICIADITSPSLAGVPSDSPSSTLLLLESCGGEHAGDPSDLPLARASRKRCSSGLPSESSKCTLLKVLISYGASSRHSYISVLSRLI